MATVSGKLWRSSANSSLCIPCCYAMVTSFIFSLGHSDDPQGVTFWDKLCRRRNGPHRSVSGKILSGGHSQQQLSCCENENECCSLIACLCLGTASITIPSIVNKCFTLHKQCGRTTTASEVPTTATVVM